MSCEQKFLNWETVCDFRRPFLNSDFLNQIGKDKSQSILFGHRLKDLCECLWDECECGWLAVSTERKLIGLKQDKQTGSANEKIFAKWLAFNDFQAAFVCKSRICHRFLSANLNVRKSTTSLLFYDELWKKKKHLTIPSVFNLPLKCFQISSQIMAIMHNAFNHL